MKDTVSTFGEDWIVFERIGGNGIRITNAVEVAEAFRGAILSYAPSPVPAALSGHERCGAKLERPHAAFVGLPDIDGESPVATLSGVALIPPRQLSIQDRQVLEDTLRRWTATAQPVLTMGRTGRWKIRPIDASDTPSPTSLAPTAWCHASRYWTTVTPIALDRNPGFLFGKGPKKQAKAHAHAISTIAAACTHIGLPDPVSVKISLGGRLTGSASAGDYPPFPKRQGKYRRILVYADIEFDRCVRGRFFLARVGTTALVFVGHFGGRREHPRPFTRAPAQCLRILPPPISPPVGSSRVVR